VGLPHAYARERTSARWIPGLVQLRYEAIREEGLWLLPHRRELRAQQVLVVVDAWRRHVVGNLRPGSGQTGGHDEQQAQMDGHAVSHADAPVVVELHTASLRP
jgi:hypothetical protein